MKKKQAHLNAILVMALMIFGATISFGQAQIPNHRLPSQTQQSSLTQNQQAAKQLFETVHNVTLTDNDFREKCTTNVQNSDDWQVVKDTYVSDPNANLTTVNALVDAMNAKLN